MRGACRRDGAALKRHKSTNLSEIKTLIFLGLIDCLSQEVWLRYFGMAAHQITHAAIHTTQADPGTLSCVSA